MWETCKREVFICVSLLKTLIKAVLIHNIGAYRIKSSMKNDRKVKHLEQKEQLADLFSLPHDIVCGASNVSIIGSMRVVIENYKGILEYDKEVILLQGKQSKIKVCGNCLKVRSYNEEEIIIDGKIDGILFIK